MRMNIYGNLYYLPLKCFCYVMFVQLVFYLAYCKMITFGQCTILFVSHYRQICLKVRKRFVLYCIALCLCNFNVFSIVRDDTIRKRPWHSLSNITNGLKSHIILSPYNIFPMLLYHCDFVFCKWCLQMFICKCVDINVIKNFKSFLFKRRRSPLQPVFTELHRNIIFEPII